ncbi:hypothetical protein HanHA89_Chr17g0691061 [Helianthus annuus]|nr:hypothetical protein HanHA89_Chr17g0691061 [Helianthus annuus]
MTSRHSPAITTNVTKDQSNNANNSRNKRRPKRPINIPYTTRANSKPDKRSKHPNPRKPSRKHPFSTRRRAIHQQNSTMCMQDTRSYTLCSSKNQHMIVMPVFFPVVKPHSGS